jgi:transposase
MGTILLLSPPTPVAVKDAARAVKRVDGLVMQEVTEETLSELLSLPGMKVTQYAMEQQGEDMSLHLFCEHEYDVALCPRCEKVMVSGYDHKDRCVRHLDVWHMRTLVHFAQRRFDCLVCGQPFTENLVWLDRQTVKDIFKTWAKKQTGHQSDRREVRVLGVDEISVRKGHKQYALVLSDLERRCVIDVLPNRKRDTFETWLDNLSEAQRQAIKVVSMDMWAPYRLAVQTKLPHAQIVADRFHVMKQLHHQVDLMRRALQKKAQQANAALYQLLKGNRWLLLKKRSELTPDEEAKLEQILDASHELRTLYLLKEEFRTICDQIHDRAQAERFLRGWIWKAVATGSRYLARFVKTLRNWWHEFLNYFDDRVTQGFVEGINRAIRGIINRAFGFRDFDNFRLQVLVEHGYT